MTRTSKIPAHRARRKPPFFLPVPLRTRRDGWTVERQCGFLAMLYVTGSAAMAARAVGMSRNAAYRLRAREGAEGFAQAWDHVLTPPGCGRVARRRTDFRKVTQAALQHRVEAGLVQPVLFRGEMRAVRRKQSNSDLLRLLARLDAAARRAERGEDEGGRAAPGGVLQNGGLCVTRGPSGTCVNARPQTAPEIGTGSGSCACARLTARAICGPSAADSGNGRKGISQ